MTYDKLNDSLDKKMLDFNLKMLALLALLVIKPLALATEPFFRKNFGERYFTGMGLFISIMLWNLAGKASYGMHGSPLLGILQDAHCYKLAGWIQEYHIAGRFAWIISGAYGWMGMQNYLRLKSRRRNGREWHSMSRGESIFGSENKVRDILIGVCVWIVLSTIAPALGLLFSASQYASYYLAAKAQRSFYNRYLDIVDAKIENEFMQQCLDKGEPPTDVNGFFYPLPKSIQGENAVRVARVVATTQFDANAPVAEQPMAQPQGQPVRSETGFAAQAEPDFIAKLRAKAVACKPAFDNAVRTASKAASAVAAVLASKQFLRATLAVLILISVAIISILGIELIKSHWQSQPKTPVIQPVSPPPAAQIDNPTPALRMGTVSPVPVPEPVSYAPQVSATPPAPALSSPVNAVPPAAPKPVAVATVHPVEGQPSQSSTSVATPLVPATDVPRQDSVVVVQQDGKSNTLVSAKISLVAAIDALNTFSNYCVATLAADNDRIGRIPNNGIRDKMSVVSQRIQSWTSQMVSHQQEFLESLTAGADADASIKRSIEKMNIDRASVTNALTRFETDIYNAALRR